MDYNHYNKFVRDAEETVYQALGSIVETRARQNMYVLSKLTVVSTVPLENLTDKQVATLIINSSYTGPRGWEGIFLFSYAICTAKLELISREDNRYYYMAKIAGELRFYSERICPEDHRHISYDSTTFGRGDNRFQVYFDFFAYHTHLEGDNINTFFRMKLSCFNVTPTYCEIFKKYRVIISNDQSNQGIALADRRTYN